MKTTRSAIHTLCALSLLTAMMVLLKMTLSIQTPYFKFNFASLPIVLAAMLFGPLEGAAVAVLGEFIVQVIGPYGLVPTTFLWIWPPAIRALVVGSAALWFRRTGLPLERRPLACCAVCVLGAVLTTTGNTAGLWLDSLFYRTSFAPVLFITPGRYVTGAVTAVLVAAVCMPLMHLLRRSGILDAGGR